MQGTYLKPFAIPVIQIGHANNVEVRLCVYWNVVFII